MVETKEKPKSAKTNGKPKAKKPKAKKAKAPKVKEEPKPKTLSEIQAEHYESIKRKEIEVGELEREFIHAKEIAKNAKEAFESADHQLRRLISAGPDAQRKLPFTDNPPAAKPAERTPAKVKITKQVKSEIPGDDWTLEVGEEFDCTVNPQGAVAATVTRLKDPHIGLKPDEFEVIAWVEPQPSANNDAWRETNLADLFSGTLLERLTDAGITTIGKLADYTSDEHKRLTDLKGVGPGMEAKIGDTMAEWFAKHPEHCGKTARPATLKIGDSEPVTLPMSESNGKKAKA